MAPKPAFDASQPFEAIEDAASKPAFDPRKPFEAVAAPAAEVKPAFDPNAQVEPIESPPLPRSRPASAPGIVQPTQEMPPVAPLDDVPFRAGMRGKVTDPETGVVSEAPGLTDMYTGAEAYDTWKAGVTKRSPAYCRLPREL